MFRSISKPGTPSVPVAHSGVTSSSSRRPPLVMVGMLTASSGMYLKSLETSQSWSNAAAMTWTLTNAFWW